MDRFARIANRLVAADFNAALGSFLEYCQKVLTDYMTENYPNTVKSGMLPTLATQEGSRYVRIAKVETSGRSAWAFVDKTNGDVLKAAGWGTPAKHARGNIYDPSTWRTIGPYGPAYLR